MRRKIAVLSVLAGILFFSSAGFGAPPVLEVSPTYMEFSAEEGGTNPASQALSIWRGSGNGPLMWDVTEDCNWLSIAPTSGTSMGEVDIVGVFININGLGAGTYNCQLTVTGDRADNSPQIVDVNLVITGPVISLSATQFNFTAIYGGPNPADKILGISNTGTGTLNWEITYDCNWLGVEPNDGNSTGEVDDVNLSVDITGLSRGTYDCNLTVSDPNAMNSPQTVGVSLSVIAEGLWVEPGSFDVSVLEGTSLQETLTITNDGNEAVDYIVRSRPVGDSGGSALAKGAFADAGVVSSVREEHDFTVAGNAAYKAGEVIVRFAPAPDGQVRSMADRDGILSSLGGGYLKESFEIVEGLSSVKLPGWMSVEEALERFNGAQGILYAEPDYEVEADATFPFDPRFDELWGMHNTGQSGGTADADIDAPEAWDIGTGSDEIVVAVIDTGVDYVHADLALNMWENEAEKNGTPGVDDDGNGYIDDIYGYDFCNNDGDPMDDHYHGTHCAGTIGGVGDNGEGVAGVCWTVKIMAVKFLNSGGSGWTSDAIKCVDYARLMGTDVTSNSWGGGGYSQGLKDAIDAAGAAGMLFVAAAGNSSSNTDSYPHYPSSYDCESLISVMSTNRNDAKSGFSNWGPTTVDLGAPGSSILSCQLGGGYKYADGTSMATPHVAGACALLWSMDPALSNSEVKDILLRTVDPTLVGLCVSEGRLNLHGAILETRVPWIELEPAEGTLGPGDSNVIDVTFNAFEEGMEMPAGTYEAEIVVVSDDPCGPVTVGVTMTVNADDLEVSPHVGLDANGLEGGPFEPSCVTYTLTNNGSSPVNWDTSAVQSWLSVEPNNGVLDVNDWIDVNVCISAEANLLDPNIYLEAVIFENLDSGSIKPRPVTLMVRPADRFTESFGNDLDFLSLMFSPDGSNAYYEACRERVEEFPTDPNGGTSISLGDDDFAEVVLSNDANVLFYGTRYDRFYVGSNGYITFGQGDSNSSASLENHFALWRISGLFTDLDPSSGGSVSYKQFEDFVVVTFEDVPLSGDSGATNSFQIEMFFVDGSICVSWLELAATNGVAGLSKGKGLPPAYFSESDLTGYLPCRPWCDVSRDYSVNFEDYVVLAAHWLEEDCGIPYWCEQMDLDLSGTADGVDLRIFAEDWLETDSWWLEPVAHWKFDEGGGDSAYDSARFNHGTSYGALWTTGKFGGALSFDGSGDYVEVAHNDSQNLVSGGTVAAWVKLTGSYRQAIVTKHPSTSSGGYFLFTSSGSHMGFGITGMDWSETIWVYTSGDAITGEWAFYVGTFDSSTVSLYENGVLVNSAANTLMIGTTSAPLYIGRWQYDIEWDCDGLIDDVRVYDRALNADEIAELYREGLGGKAFGPSPADGETGVDPDVVLSWEAGKYTVSHDVYFGTDYNDVNDATTVSPEYIGNQESTSWDPYGLEFGTTYYWRIDEVNESDGNSPWKGSVWSFTTWVDIVSYWKFDEGSGTVASDSTGTNHGTIYGANWTSGQVGGALSFDGSGDYVEVAHNDNLNLVSEGTVAAWVNLNDSYRQAIVTKQPSTSSGNYFLFTSSGNHAGFGLSNGNWSQKIWVYTPGEAITGEWAFYVGTFDSSTVSLYENGVLVGSAANTIAVVTTSAPLYIGRWQYDAEWDCDGLIDDVRVYDRALDVEEISELYREGLGIVGKAFGPSPADGETGADPDVVLSWQPGKYTASHDVYFGTDYNDVNDATTTSPEYMGNQDVNSWDPCGLDLNSTYYWRIDEVNESDVNSPWKGDVWSFTTWVEFDPNLGLVSWWKFDEGSGTTAYDSAGDNDGTLNGGTAWTTGQIGSALSFDGSGDYVEVAHNDNLNLVSEGTVAAWVNLSDSSREAIVTKHPSTSSGNYFLFTSTSSHMGMGITDGDWSGGTVWVATPGDAITNEWAFYAGTFDGNSVNLYENGVLVNSLPNTITPVTTTAPLYIGRWGNDTDWDCSGLIDDVRVYDRTLTGGEVWQLYQSGL